LKNTIALTINRMKLALRNRLFMVFSLIMPMIFLFLFLGVFSRGVPSAMPPLLAQVVVITVMGNFWGLSVQLVTYREQGILRRYRLAPIGPAAMLISSVIANYVMTLPTVVIEFLLARYIFHMTVFGNVWGVFVLCSLGIISFASLGLIIASVMNTMQETQVINQLIWLAFIFLSGATFPLVMFSKYIQDAALFLPATYLVDATQRAMNQAVSLWSLGPHLISLVGTAVIAFSLSVKLFRWDASEKATRNAKLWALATIIPFIALGTWELFYGQLKRDASVTFELMQQRMTPPQGQTDKKLP
jgi:ABC-type multidrug transport system permease subunit